MSASSLVTRELNSFYWNELELQNKTNVGTGGTWWWGSNTCNTSQFLIFSFAKRIFASDTAAVKTALSRNTPDLPRVTIWKRCHRNNKSVSRFRGATALQNLSTNRSGHREITSVMKLHHEITNVGGITWHVTAPYHLGYAKHTSAGIYSGICGGESISIDVVVRSKEQRHVVGARHSIGRHNCTAKPFNTGLVS